MISSYLLEPRKKKTPTVGDPGGLPPVENDASDQNVYDRAATPEPLPAPRNAAWAGDSPEAQQIVRAAMLKPKDPAFNSMGAPTTDPGNPSMAPKSEPGRWSQKAEAYAADLESGLKKGRSVIPLLGRSWDAEMAQKQAALRTALLAASEEERGSLTKAQVEHYQALAERERATIPYEKSRAYRVAGTNQDKAGQYHQTIIGENGPYTFDTGVTGPLDIRKRAILRNGELLTSDAETGDIEYEDTTPFRSQGGAVLNRGTGEYTQLPPRVPSRQPGASPYDQRRAQVAYLEAAGIVPKGSLAQYDAMAGGSATLGSPTQGAASAPPPPGAGPKVEKWERGPNGQLRRVK